MPQVRLGLTRQPEPIKLRINRFRIRPRSRRPAQSIRRYRPCRPNTGTPCFCGRKEPIGAIVLIALGMLFLLDQLDIFNGRLKDFIWPLALIALGVWLFVRRFEGSQGGSK